MGSAVLARVLLRYGVGVLVGLSLFSDEVAQKISADPDVVQALSILLAFAGTALSEGFYALAKRRGWRT